VRSFAASLLQPYCGVNSGFEAARWLQQGEGMTGGATSLALIPLTRFENVGTPAQSFGMLVLGSPDPTRYTAEMGVEFLARIGDVASAALSRLLTPRLLAPREASAAD